MSLFWVGGNQVGLPDFLIDEKVKPNILRKDLTNLP
jgi:hypothetical protein